MQSLLANKDAIFEIKKRVEEKDEYLYNHYEISNIEITSETISIIMTSCNRSIQTYFALNTFQNSSFKNLQIIIVDDSDIDPIKKDELIKYPFFIDLITIKKENKNWINPVVNYNIGFQYIKGDKVVIQNAEICHIGDVLGFIGTHMIPDNYYVCDVKAVKSFSGNNFIYKSNINTIDIYNLKNTYRKWYQAKTRNSNLHFLVGMTKSTFDKIKNFSYDYTFGIDYDDNDFIIKIKSKNINFVNLFHDEYNFGGIHLFHESSFLNKEIIEKNDIIYYNKLNYYNKTGEYIDITENIIFFSEKYNIILNNNADIKCE